MLSHTLVGLYIDEVSNYIDRWGGAVASLFGVMISILLYANDIVLISDSIEGLISRYKEQDCPFIQGAMLQLHCQFVIRLS